ncbi:hypothetical protein LCGC14_2348590, partial [marine sediment metagenome]
MTEHDPFQVDLMPSWFRPWFRDLAKPLQCILGIPLLVGCLWIMWTEIVQDGVTGDAQQPPPQKAIFISLFLFVASIIISELLRPKPKIQEAKPAGLGDFQFPTATEGRPVPLLWGRVRIKGANEIWHGDLAQTAITEKVKTGLFSSQRITKGWRYHLGIQFALCRGPGVVLVKVQIGDEEAFSGSVASGSRFDINKPQILGGDDFGAGGIQATVD